MRHQGPSRAVASPREQRRQALGAPRRLLVKIGSNLLTTAKGRLSPQRVQRLADQMAALRGQGRELIIVSSGAISAGVGALGLAARPGNLPGLQAVAAVGQSRLIQTYDEALARHGLHVGQVLLSREDMENRQRFLNTRNTLRALLDRGCVPVINENDSVCVEEIRYGDNDFLAAHLAAVAMADLVVLLTTVAGLYDTDGGGRRRVVRVVRSISSDILDMDHGGTSAAGTGGMATKLQAAAMITKAGVPVVIASGRARNVLPRIVAGRSVGTLFLPAARPMASRKRWIGFTARPRGRLLVDEGARRALVERGKSLLASGVRGLVGRFEKGDVVAVAIEGRAEFARGLTNYSSAELALIQGCHTRHIKQRLGYKDYDEVVHRDNLVLVD